MKSKPEIVALVPSVGEALQAAMLTNLIINETIPEVLERQARDYIEASRKNAARFRGKLELIKRMEELLDECAGIKKGEENHDTK